MKDRIDACENSAYPKPTPVQFSRGTLSACYLSSFVRVY